MLRVSLEPSYVLHGRPYRESSLLLEAFTRDHGRVGLVARGARGSKSRWKSLLQPFRPLLLSWNQRGELGTLVAADQVASPPAARGEAIFCGLYINELLMRGLHRSDPHPELFETYRQLLAELLHSQQPEPLLRAFEKQLLDALGFGLQLEYEHATGAPVTAAAWYDYVPEHGLVRRDRTLMAETGVDDFRLVSGAALLALQCNAIREEHQLELKRLMRRVLRHHLGDKPLASHALFQ
jgi:DNA repair protein RecO (recombination protein O)